MINVLVGAVCAVLTIKLVDVAETPKRRRVKPVERGGGGGGGNKGAGGKGVQKAKREM